MFVFILIFIFILFIIFSLLSFNPVRGNCVKQIDAGQPCDGLGTCIDQAECTSSTQGVCTCNDAFSEKEGACVPLKEVGQVCTGEEECTPNSICFDTCRCRSGFILKIVCKVWEGLLPKMDHFVIWTTSSSDKLTVLKRSKLTIFLYLIFAECLSKLIRPITV